jgi:hypothetical protein
MNFEQYQEMYSNKDIDVNDDLSDSELLMSNQGDVMADEAEERYKTTIEYMAQYCVMYGYGDVFSDLINRVADIKYELSKGTF